MDSHDQTNCAQNVAKIRELNDLLRRQHEGGQVFITNGIGALPVPTMARILFAVRDFDDFDKGNDPYSEHDFGMVEVDGHSVFFKIDLYDGHSVKGTSSPFPCRMVLRAPRSVDAQSAHRLVSGRGRCLVPQSIFTSLD